MIFTMRRRNLSEDTEAKKGNPKGGVRGGKVDEKTGKGRDRRGQWSKGSENHFKGGGPQGCGETGIRAHGTRRLRKPEEG